MADLTLDQYRLVRTIPDAELEAVLGFSERLRKSGVDLAEVLPFLALERSYRPETAREIVWPEPQTVRDTAPSGDQSGEQAAVGGPDFPREVGCTCAVCGASYTVTITHPKDYIRKTCSWDCLRLTSKQGGAKSVALRTKKSHGTSEPSALGYPHTLDLTCTICSRPHTQTIYYPSQEGQARKTCSAACRRQAQREGGAKAHGAKAEPTKDAPAEPAPPPPVRPQQIAIEPKAPAPKGRFWTDELRQSQPQGQTGGLTKVQPVTDQANCPNCGMVSISEVEGGKHRACGHHVVLVEGRSADGKTIRYASPGYAAQMAERGDSLEEMIG